MNIEISIDVDIVESIIDLPTKGEDISLLFYKRHDKSLGKMIIEKYETQRIGKGFVVA